jgi:hypothetical protein
MQNCKQEGSGASTNVSNDVRLREIICGYDMSGFRLGHLSHVFIENRSGVIVCAQVLEDAYTVDLIERDLSRLTLGNNCPHGTTAHLLKSQVPTANRVCLSEDDKPSG